MVPVRESYNSGGAGEDLDRRGLVGQALPWKP